MALDFALKPPTRFAPAERETIDRIKAEHALLIGSGAAAAILDTLPDAVAVVNEFRQIVHANRSFLDFASVKQIDEIQGMRLGEFMGCPHAVNDAGGCGTHEACRTCGAVNAVLGAIGCTHVTSEVELEVEHNGRARRLCFDISAAPLPVKDRTFALMTVHKARWSAIG